MNNLTRTDSSGKKISFSQLLEEHSITIPIIQRDYAQGREKEVEVRTTFLKALIKALNDKKQLNLDFVYGNIENYSLIPLDGQQRLTTLFLLHWYIANKEGKYEDYRRLLVDEKGKVKFSYETRSSSKEFCEGLITSGIDFKHYNSDGSSYQNKLSAAIQDSQWYFLSWQNDPTVKSMLIMLDEIHKLLHSKGNGYYSSLVDKDNPLITFQFLRLDDFKLTDDIYIKMNARGKLLTSFETFKAWMQKYIQQSKIQISTKRWLNKCDIEWTDIFWNYRNEDSTEIDSEYYNYFVLMTLFFYVEKEEIKIENNRISDDGKRAIIIELLNEDKILHQTFKASMSEIGLNNTFNFLSYFENKSSRQKLETHLNDLFPDGNRNILKMLFSANDSGRKLTLWDKTYLYSFISFVLEKQKNIKDYSDDDFQQLFDWVRVSKNLIYNTTIDRPGDFVNTVKQIKKISKYSDKIIEYIAKNKIKGFSGEQISEEKEKAGLMLNDKSNKWIVKFLIYENHEYFYGQIGFLLELSKVKKKYDFDDFNKYASKAAKLFEKEMFDNDECLVERAILTAGDYLIHRGQNKNFCKYETGTLRLRRENWREVFKDPEKIEYLKIILDNIGVGKEKQSLNKLINKYSDKNDWRYHFIKDSKLINYCNDRNIRYEEDYDRYFLLSKSRLNGYHAEYYSFAFYNNYLKDNVDDYAPFIDINYINICGDGDPGILFNSKKHGIELNVVYKKGNYLLTVSSGDNNPIDTTTKHSLSALKYKDNNGYYEKKMKGHKGVYLNKRILELGENLK